MTLTPNTVKERTPEPATRAHRFRVVTVSVLAVTAMMTGLQGFFPQVLVALERVPGALKAGQWWRLITPIFVHSEGWRQIAFNLICIALLGPMVERLFGRRAWLLLYFVAGFIGNVAGFAWHIPGAGASVAGCGLLGAVAAWLLSRPVLQAKLGGGFILLGAIGLSAISDNHGPPLLAGIAIGLILLRRKRMQSPVTRFPA